MAVEAKICGIREDAAARAAVEGGAAFVGFIFYPPSPRAVAPEVAARIAAGLPSGLGKVAVTVDADDAALGAILKAYDFDLLQLHGKESPARVAEVRERFGRPVMKAIPVAGAEDLGRVRDYLPVVDRLLFDAKPPKDMKGALPGGNALSFDWTLLAGKDWPKPWFLSGGLDAGNLAEALRVTRAPAVDVSSGVEDKPGRKNPDKIAAFLQVLSAA
ncbi:MAG: phosphoribosylanthranilate isomerase [Kiloniellales bacterium]|nr:phosphoribosylanthranilate isomerase [Kiloniellales bacterium]MDJ0968647.1 phosphoribosylanthranilate isomerase [Kiloniellales bacterium]